MIFFRNTATDSDGKVIVFEALDDEVLSGKCTLVLGDKFAEVTDLHFENNAMYIGEGLLKSAYNYAALKNYYMAKCSVKSIESLLLRLGFELKDDEYLCDIPTILIGSCKSCGEK